MPSGLENALGSFKRAMDVNLYTVHSQLALVHLDYIVIFSNSLEAHINYLRDVLTLLCVTDRTTNLKKCKLSSNTINYIDHVTHPGQLAVSQHHWRDPKIGDPNKYHRTTIVPGLLQNLLTFHTQLCYHCLTTEQEIAARPTSSLRETRQGLATRPTNHATETNHATNIASSEINR